MDEDDIFKSDRKGNHKNDDNDDEYNNEEFESYEEQDPDTCWYTLYPPPGHNKGHYIHTVYVKNNRSVKYDHRISEHKKQKMLQCLGFLTSANYVLVNKRLSKVLMYILDNWKIS